MPVYTVYCERKPRLAVEARLLKEELQVVLGMKKLENVRILTRYLIEGAGDQVAGDFAALDNGVFGEANVDDVYHTLPAVSGACVFAVQSIAGQFDQRAESCEKCIALALDGERPTVAVAKIYILEGAISAADVDSIKNWLINPVETREVSLDIPATIIMDYPEPDSVKTLDGFIALDKAGLAALRDKLGLAMDADDLAFCQGYFKADEQRDPTMTEIRMIDTYWSDHCRHTTFLTELDAVDIAPERLKAVFARYMTLREELYPNKQRPVTMMDLATVGMKSLRKNGFLNDLDESEEINACSVKIKADVDGVEQDWLLMFKNETHNHPTEIEPFGGASTCLGGAIRDPLSGRSYVYQAMRITGAGDPTVPVAETMSGKLAQRKLVRTAAAGYSSYGNQIGAATGHVQEIYHPGYIAKRMELGAVIAAAPADWVRREVPADGDVVILLGGRTGRDGCGGATGSSRSHTAESIEGCSAEVQKGDAPEERKIVRLFRRPEATRLIKRCNDFGAGGVSVSIGELADGLDINLDVVPVKYPGLDGTELAISESQERMSIVVAKEDADKLIALADEENLEATIVARVTAQPRLVMSWRGDKIVDLSREFLNSNGVRKHARANITAAELAPVDATPITGESLTALMSSLACCGQRGLIEGFDATAGGGAMLMPLGGKYAATPAQSMAAKLPVLGETTTCSVLSYGFDPRVSEQSTFHGAAQAVITSVAKLVAAGASRKQCWLSFQEYFEALGDDATRWGKPVAALLGALEAQLELKVASIGGKDSMSGSYEGLNVPPTLVSFAVSLAKQEQLISPEFKQAGSSVYLLRSEAVGDPDYDEVRKLLDTVETLAAAGKIRAAWVLGAGGTAEGIAKMSFGNRIGLRATAEIDTVQYCPGFILEAGALAELEQYRIGETIEEFALYHGDERIDLAQLQAAWEGKLESVFPSTTEAGDCILPATIPVKINVKAPAIKTAKPKLFLPIFPGTSGEYELELAAAKAGATVDTFVFKNRIAADIAASMDALAKRIADCNMLFLPGGMSGGDEPDGPAKMITTIMKNPAIADAVHALLARDGLIAGVGNGFHALLKLGLLSGRKIGAVQTNDPAIVENLIGRFQSKLVNVKLLSNASPWLAALEENAVYTSAVAALYGRFVADDAAIASLHAAGQIACVYTDHDGKPSMATAHNPAGSMCAIDGVTSPDGRVFGKLSHFERVGVNQPHNAAPVKYMDIFSGAVNYYK